MNLADQIDGINLKAESLLFTDSVQAYSLFEEAGKLSQTGEYTQEPYLEGLAVSIAGRAFVNLDEEPALAMKQCQEVFRLLDGKSPTSAVALAQFTMSGIYLLQGNYPLSLEWGLKSLKTSRALGFPLWEALALDTIALVHDKMDEYDKALSEMQSALDLMQKSSEDFFTPTIMNNMAMTFLHAGDHTSALEIGLRGLDLNCKFGMADREAYLLDTVGQILMSMGDFSQAEALLLKARNNCQYTDRTIVTTSLGLNLGRVYLAQKNYIRAEEEVTQALINAQSGNFRSEEADCHRFLVEIHEKKGDLVKALEHFRIFYEIEKSITLAESAQRVSVLNAQQEFENAVRDSEIFRLRNVDLQQEIERRKQLEAKLIQLATTDELTGIHNRRSFFERSQIEFNRAIRYNHPMTLLMADVDHFKNVNDTFGHATGDQVLIGLGTVISRMLRDSDILGRYGGEEFCILLPDTNSENGLIAAERLRKGVELKQFETISGSLSITVSIGIATFDLHNQKITSLETLVNNADHALYKAKQGGRNRVETDK